MFKRLVAAAGLGCILGMGSHMAAAGPFADDMAKCLVNSTSEADRADLIRWIFAAMSLNPNLSSMVAISKKDRDDLTAKTANLYSRLMFDTCKSQVVAAVRNEGPHTIEYAFQVLGQVAVRGIMADKHVGESLQALGRDIDPKKIKELMAATGK